MPSPAELPPVGLQDIRVHQDTTAGADHGGILPHPVGAIQRHVSATLDQARQRQHPTVGSQAQIAADIDAAAVDRQRAVGSNGREPRSARALHAQRAVVVHFDPSAGVEGQQGSTRLQRITDTDAAIRDQVQLGRIQIEHVAVLVHNGAARVDGDALPGRRRGIPDPHAAAGLVGDVAVGTGDNAARDQLQNAEQVDVAAAGGGVLHAQVAAAAMGDEDVGGTDRYLLHRQGAGAKLLQRDVADAGGRRGHPRRRRQHIIQDDVAVGRVRTDFGGGQFERRHRADPRLRVQVQGIGGDQPDAVDIGTGGCDGDGVRLRRDRAQHPDCAGGRQHDVTIARAGAAGGHGRDIECRRARDTDVAVPGLCVGDAQVAASGLGHQDRAGPRDRGRHLRRRGRAVGQANVAIRGICAEGPRPHLQRRRHGADPGRGIEVHGVGRDRADAGNPCRTGTDGDGITAGRERTVELDHTVAFPLKPAAGGSASITLRLQFTCGTRPGEPPPRDGLTTVAGGSRTASLPAVLRGHS